MDKLFEAIAAHLPADTELIFRKKSVGTGTETTMRVYSWVEAAGVGADTCAECVIQGEESATSWFAEQISDILRRREAEAYVEGAIRIYRAACDNFDLRRPLTREVFYTFPKDVQALYLAKARKDQEGM